MDLMADAAPDQYMPPEEAAKRTRALLGNARTAVAAYLKMKVPTATLQAAPDCRGKYASKSADSHVWEKTPSPFCKFANLFPPLSRQMRIFLRQQPEIAKLLSGISIAIDTDQLPVSEELCGFLFSC